MMIRDRLASQNFSSKNTSGGKMEDVLAGQANMGIGSLDDNLGYACISSECGIINLIRVTNLTAEIL